MNNTGEEGEGGMGGREEGGEEGRGWGRKDVRRVFQASSLRRKDGK